MSDPKNIKSDKAKTTEITEAGSVELEESELRKVSAGGILKTDRVGLATTSITQKVNNLTLKQGDGSV